MTVLITLTTAGTDSGPFDLYSNLDGYLSAFESGVSKASLLAGYPSSLVPDFTTIIRVRSNNGSCTNYIDIPVAQPPTTTTTTTITSCIEITADAGGDCPGIPGYSVLEYTDCNGVYQTIALSTGDLLTFCTLVGGVTPAFICGDGIIYYGSSCTPTTTTSSSTSTTTSTSTTAVPTTTTTSSSSTTTSTTTVDPGTTTTTTTGPIT
jgi:hypothetical protein